MAASVKDAVAARGKIVTRSISRHREGLSTHKASATLQDECAQDMLGIHTWINVPEQRMMQIRSWGWAK